MLLGGYLCILRFCFSRCVHCGCQLEIEKGIYYIIYRRLTAVLEVE
jgi:hypothetical protein